MTRSAHRTSTLWPLRCSPGSFVEVWQKSFSSSMVDSYSMFCLFMQPAVYFPRWEVTYTRQSLCWKKSALGASDAGEKVNIKEECSLIACQFLWPTASHPEVWQKSFSSSMVDSYSMFCLFMQPAVYFPRWEVTYTRQSLCWKKSALGASHAGEKVNIYIYIYVYISNIYLYIQRFIFIYINTPLPRLTWFTWKSPGKGDTILGKPLF